LNIILLRLSILVAQSNSSSRSILPLGDSNNNSALSSSSTIRLCILEPAAAEAVAAELQDNSFEDWLSRIIEEEEFCDDR